MHTHRSSCFDKEGQQQAAPVRQEVLEQSIAQLEHQLSRHRECAHECISQEQRHVSELRMQLQRLQEHHVHLENEHAQVIRRRSSSEELLRNSEDYCARLEAKIARKRRWREEAERQLCEMAACGKEFEQERLSLRRKLSESRQEGRHVLEEAESLRDSLEQEEQLAEILKARTWALEEDNASFCKYLHEERSCRLEDGVHHAEMLKDMKQGDILIAREALKSEYCTELRSAEAAREALMTAWTKEREHWARHSAGLTAEFEQQISEAHRELQAALQVENVVKLDLAMQTHGAAATEVLKTELREEGATMREMARIEVTSEAKLCRQMALQLEERLAQARLLQESLEERAAATSEQVFHMIEPEATPSGIATPQLCELDAYAQLVQHLQDEVQREREERQAAVQSLDALRGSYHLLLQRTR